MSTAASASDAEVSVAADKTLPELSLPTPSPVRVPLAAGPDLPVIAFYCPGAGPTEWDRKTGGAPLGNFWPLDPQRLRLTHNEITGSFHNSEAAYQCLKWWQHEATRIAFQKCDAPAFKGGEDAYKLARACKKVEALSAYHEQDFDGLGKFGAMLTVLRLKWQLPGFREFLLSTGNSFLLEHNEVPDRDLVWSDNYHGGGENRLGAALMLIRGEIYAEEAGSGSSAAGEVRAWPGAVERPDWAGGSFSSNWQDVVDEVARYLARTTANPPTSAS